MEHVGTRAAKRSLLPLFRSPTTALRASNISEVVGAYVADCNGVYWGEGEEEDVEQGILVSATYTHSCN